MPALVVSVSGLGDCLIVLGLFWMGVWQRCGFWLTVLDLIVLLGSVWLRLVLVALVWWFCDLIWCLYVLVLVGCGCALRVGCVNFCSLRGLVGLGWVFGGGFGCFSSVVVSKVDDVVWVFV